MTRNAPLLLTALLALGALLLSGCGDDSTTAPGGGPEVAKTQMIPFFEKLTVEHDCDPDKENEGDFYFWFEVSLEVDPTDDETEWRTLATSTVFKETLHSDEEKILGNKGMWLDVPQIDGQIVQLRTYVEERDSANGPDMRDGNPSRITDVRVFVYDADSNCWTALGTTSGCREVGSRPVWKWTRSEQFSKDNLNPFDNDYGCEFGMRFGVQMQPAS